MTHATHDDNATTWRDLADQLTPKQIVELEYCDREQIPPGIGDHEQGALNYARAMARSNIVQAMYADIAAPADAIDEPSDWEHYDGGCYSRMYSAAKLCVRASSVVNIFGWQFTDGRPTERDIMVDVTDETMTAAEARLLAAALIEAADVLDRLTGATPPL